ncbi:MAG: hypothetical protein MJ252_13660, partial [archaeon]|nr:hypothetical protein [archaeon]
KSSILENIFEVIGNIFKVPKEYLYFDIKAEKDFTIRYNYVNRKNNSLKDIIENDFNTLNNPKEIFYFFEMGINANKYSDTLMQNILNKEIKKYSITLKKMKEEYNKYIYEIFTEIFNELEQIKKFTPLYEKIFGSLRKKILNKFGLN